MTAPGKEEEEILVEDWVEVSKRCDVESSIKLRAIEKIVSEYNRFEKAVDVVERAIRYLRSYLKDYSMEVSRNFKPNEIEVTIRIRPFDEFNTPDAVKAKLYKALLEVLGREREEEARRIADKLFESLYGT